MFNGEKYITRGINERVDIRIQLMLWEMIELLRSKGIDLDYLQIFNISNRDGKIIIEHSQEQPEYKIKYLLDVQDIKLDEDIKVYVIDSGGETPTSTMLLAEEY